ncbi:glycosyltransferase [Magnetovirga frankeli]|uniref:glycosyltransferase n=1 Tax=Magnetovirga frankeli TaxID=947516 RepID=UPI001293AE08|nr:glycosyltransferase [gamma proteobacterium SS-5]
MRILKISDVYFPRINGVSTSIQTFQREFRALGHEVTLVCPDYGIPYADELEADIVRIPARVIPMDPEDRFLHLGALRRWGRQLRPGDYDLVHIHTPFAAHYLGRSIARRLGVPTVESYHTFFEEYLFNYVHWLPKDWLRFAARRFSRAQCNEVDALVVPSGPMLQTLRDYGVDNRAEIIPTGIYLPEFTRGDRNRFRQAHGIEPDRPVLVHIGRLAHEKNIGFLLRVLARLRQQVPDVLLVLAGEGPARQALQQQAEQLDLAGHVLFVGYLARGADLDDCYLAGDAFIFASRTETQGLVLLEAMALGVPVVSTAVMGTRDILDPGLGALVAEEDEAGFAQQALRLLADSDLRRQLGEQGKAYAERWSAPLLARRMLDYYAEVVEAAKARRSTESEPS